MLKYKNRIKAPNVVGGGVAIPLGNNLYYMSGRKHETGGIDVGRDLEVEDGEIMQMRNNDVRVFSAQPIINGHSPAELVRYGGNPNDVFNAQERYKYRNRINDDGSRYKCGGRKKRPFGSDEQRTDAITDYRPSEQDINTPNYVKQNYFNEYVRTRNRHLNALKGIGQVFDPFGAISVIDGFAHIANGRYSDAALSFIQAIPLAGKFTFLSNIGKATRPKKWQQQLSRYANRDNFDRAVDEGYNRIINNLYNLSRQKNINSQVWDNAYDLHLINATRRGTRKAVNNINRIENFQTAGRGILSSEDIINGFVDDNTEKEKNKMGGLNRDKDYGSKKKPYPKVKSSDFAGSGRSYPIPTKADAIDALRLAGLHGRNDVKAKVYRKYPELKKRNGGIVSINGNVKDGLIYWANPSTGGRHKAAIGTRMLGLDRTMAVLNQSRISGVKPTSRQVDKSKEDTKPEPITEQKRNSSISLSDISDTGAGIGIGGMTAYGLYKLGTNPKVTQGIERGLTAATDKIQARMDKANKYYTAPREVIDRYNRMKINRINRGLQSIRDKAVSLALEEVDEPVTNTPTRSNTPSKFRTRINQVADKINGSETARNIASRFKTGAKNFGKFMDRISRDASSKFKGIGYIGIIGDLIRNFNATEEDDRQQRLNIYRMTGDYSILKDGDIPNYPTGKDMVRCGGKRKKADLGTSSNDRTLSTPLFSLFGPRYDRVLEINYGDNGAVNSYNGIDRDLGNPSAGFRGNLNNGYYDMGIDYFNNRRYNYTRPTDDTNVEEVTNPTEVAPRRRVATSPAPNPLGAAPTPLSSEPIPLTIPASNAPVPTINQKSVEALRTPSTTDDGHYAGMFGPVTATDWISLGGNLLGSLGSWFAGRANPEFNYTEPDRPIMEQPVRMVTTYNNRPQIANIEQTVRRSMRDISGNTGSSRAALQRMQRVRNAGTQGINQLEAEKENIETQLRNADAANRQRVRARNVSAYNEYLSQRNRLRNAKNTIDYENKMRRINNNVGLINNLNISLQDFLKGINQRNQFNNTLGYLRGASPNVDDRIFRDMGVNFSRMFNTNRR